MIEKLNLTLEEQLEVEKAIKVLKKIGAKTIDDAEKMINRTHKVQKGEFSASEFADFLKITEIYKLKQVSRSCSNNYYCEKDNIDYKRKETTAEHVYSASKIADYFLALEEFSHLDKLKVRGMLLYHDDIEIVTKDVSISEREMRKDKDRLEVAALPKLAQKYPLKLQEELLSLDKEFREGRTTEAKFAHAIDKMDALLHELKYPEDWGPKGFDEKNVRAWFGPAFEYSPTFSWFFENLIQHLKVNGYFEK